MRYRITILCILFLIGTRVDATTLKGVVIDNGGNPISGVRVRSEDAADSDTTSSLGMFRLDFPNKTPGQVVKLEVTKPLYKVDDEYELIQVLPEDANVKPAKVTMRKKSTEEKVITVVIFDDGLQTMSILDLYKKAVSQFVNGYIVVASKLLDAEELNQRLRYTKKDKSKAEKYVLQNEQVYLFKAWLHTLRFQFDEAESLYQQIYELVPQSPDAIFAYAVFCQIQNQYDTAIDAYQLSLKLAKQNQYKLMEIHIQNNLGVLYAQKNFMNAARDAYGKAFNICIELAKQVPQIFLPDLLETLNNLCVLEILQNRNGEGLKVYNEVLTIHRHSSQQDYENYQRNTSRILQDRKILESDKKKTEEIQIETYKKILNDIELIVKKYHLIDPIKNLYTNDIEILRYEENLKRENARYLYSELLDISYALADQNTEIYLIHVANAHNNFGILYSAQNLIEKATMEFEHALRVYNVLAEIFPQTYEPYEAGTRYNMGILYLNKNQMKNARVELDEALRIYEGFAQHNPDRYNHYVARVKHILREINKTE